VIKPPQKEGFDLELTGETKEPPQNVIKEESSPPAPPPLD